MIERTEAARPHQKEESSIESLRSEPMTIFLARAAETLLGRPLVEFGGKPIRFEDLPSLEDGDRRVGESVNMEYNGAIRDIRIGYSWSYQGDGTSSYGGTEARWIAGGPEVEWMVRYNDGNKSVALPEVMHPSEIHEAYFRDAVIRALKLRLEASRQLSGAVSSIRKRRPTVTVKSDLL